MASYTSLKRKRRAWAAEGAFLRLRFRLVQHPIVYAAGLENRLVLAYNLVRKVLAQAALAGRVTPRQLNFTGALVTMEAFRWLLMVGPVTGAPGMVTAFLVAVGTHRVGNRPGRVEPRENKRRKKSKKLLMRTRAERRAELLAGLGL